MYTKTNRNISIDLFKCISMIMVIILHILGHGGILFAAVEGSLQSYILWLLEILCMCAVNCFAIISGYLLITRLPSYKRILNLWIQVVFYCIIITFFIILFFPNISSVLGKKNIILQSVFPLLNNQCGYFTCYFLLSIFIPFLNKFLNNLSHREYKTLVLLLFICFSIIPILSRSDLFGTDNGYAAIWLFVMYIYGAYIKLFYKHNNGCPAKYLFFYFSSSTLAWFFKFFLFNNEVQIAQVLINKDIFIYYTSPFIVLSSIFLLLFFININIKSKSFSKFICYASSGSFAVILIHDHPIIRSYFMNNLFVHLLQTSITMLIINVLGYSFLIFFACIFIDSIRQAVFNKLNFDKLVNRMLYIIKKIHKYMLTILKI
ncbi:acyltransferase [[Clostridium] innocuum]|nr:acyltransferase [[Clostridium] innocuum]